MMTQDDIQNPSQELARSPGNIPDVLGVLLTRSPKLGPELGRPKTMIIQIVQFIVAQIHMSAGPHGIVAWIQPPHVAAGVGIIQNHLTGWWEVQK
jgi:hypothetical protein